MPPVTTLHKSLQASFHLLSISWSLRCARNRDQSLILMISQAPNEEERLEILQALLWNSTLAADISLKDLARQTAALIAIDLSDLVFRAKLSALERA